jgi:hypothetical protein
VSGAAEELLRNVQGTLRAIRRLALVYAAMIASAFSSHLAAAETASEQKLKSAYLYNFTKFVEWPAGHFASAADPLIIGLIADDAMLKELLALVANRQSKGRPLLVRRVAGPSDLQAVHILFVSGDERIAGRMRDRAEQAAILVVGEDKDCRLQGGSICFLQEGEKLRFEVNVDTAERSQLKISSQLLKLALAVNKGT